MTVKVLLVDDHPLVLEALRREVAGDAEFECRTAASLAEARAELQTFRPDVVVCDVRLPDGNGLKLIEESSSGQGRPAFLMLSSFDTAQYVATARRLGAAGYLLKTEPAETIFAAIREVVDGGAAFGGLAEVQGIRLTSREEQVVAGVVAGQTNDEIAARMEITRRAVEAHLSRIYERAGIASRTELAVRAEREQWLESG